MEYDIALGMDNVFLNSLVKQVYDSLRQDPEWNLKKTLNIDKMGIKSISYDFEVSPTVNLSLSDQFKDELNELLDSGIIANGVTLSSGGRTEVFNMALMASFEISIPEVSIDISFENNDPPINKKLSLLIAINIQTTSHVGKDSLKFVIFAANASITGDPTIEVLLNSAFLPSLINEFNDKLSKVEIDSIRGNIPSLPNISLPLPIVHSSQISIYSKLGGIQPTISTPIQASLNSAFIGVSGDLIKELVSPKFPLGDATGFSWNIISGRVAAEVNAPSFISISRDGSVLVKTKANANAQLTLHTPFPFPNVSFGPSAKADLSIKFKPFFIGNELFIKVDDFDVQEFSFNIVDIGALSRFLNPLNHGLSLALNSALNPVISRIISLIPAIPVYKIPTIEIPVNEAKKIIVNLDGISLSSNSSLLIVSSESISLKF